MEFLKLLVESIMDAFEEFFDALVAPSVQFTLYAFFVSLGFVAYTIVAKIFVIRSFVELPEAITTSIILGAIVLIDTGARDTIKNNLSKIKGAAKQFSKGIEKVEEEGIENGSGD